MQQTFFFFFEANPNVTTWVEESSDYINIGCRFNNYDGLTSGSSYCQMVAPNQEIFKIQPGAASGRYTTLTTNLTAYTCGMEIEKPLHDFEKGIWECKIYLINDDIGGFLRVGISENGANWILWKYLTSVRNVKSLKICFAQCPQDGVLT